MAGEDIDLKLIIKALLDSKGFTEAQAEMKRLSGLAAAASSPVGGLSDKTRGLTKELSGTRGAAADLTRVLLQNIGVTGPAGEMAKAAGVGFSAFAGSATLAVAGVYGVIAAIALLAPKLIEWAKGTDDVDEATKGLKDSIVGMLPELEQYIRLVPNATAELKALFEVSRKQAFDKQLADIKALDEAIATNEKTIDGLRERNLMLAASGVQVGDVVAKNNASIADLAETNEDLRTKLNALLAAQEDHVLLGEQIRIATDNATAASARRTKALEEETKALDRFFEYSNVEAAQAHRDATLRAEFIKDQEKEGDAAAAAAKKILAANDARLRSSAKLSLEEAKRDIEEQKSTLRSLSMQELKLRRLQAISALELQLINDEIRARRAATAAMVATAAQAVATIVGVFTKNKAVNIAAAIADTYAGATKALAIYGPTPMGYATMALAIANGLANVKRIQEANVGFDDPFADLFARKMGRKSAEDFAKHFGGMFSATLPGAMAAATNIYNQSTTINRGTSVGSVNYNSIVGARRTQQLKQLNRDLIAIDRMEDRTTVGR